MHLKRSAFVAASCAGLMLATSAPVAAAPPDEPAVTRKIETYTITHPALVNDPGAVVATLQRDGDLDRYGIAPGGPPTTPPRRTAQDHQAMAVRDGSEYGTPSEKYASGMTTQAPTYDYISEAECRDNADLASREAGWIKNHFAYCQRTGVAGVAIECTILPPGCRPVGAFAATAMLIGYGKKGERTADFDFILDGLIATGVYLRSGNDFEVEIECSGSGTGGCSPGSPSGRDSSFSAWLLDNSADLQLISPASAPSPSLGEQKATGVFHVRYEIDMSGGFSDSSGDFPEGGMRFDSAWYLTYSEGSIFDRVTPWLSYSVDDPAVSYSAWNIYNAQNFPEETEPVLAGKQLAGESAEDPLHRLFHDKARRKANRSEATSFCRTRWPGYSELGQDCDEYAFACTYEGAARYRYDGEQYRNHFAVRPIPSADNQEAGRRLGAWYGDDRILDGDPFYVRIFGADGPGPNPPTGPPAPPDDEVVDCGDGAE